MSSYTARFTKNSSHFVYWDQSQILSFTTSQKRRSQRISPSLSRQQTIKKTTLTPNGNFVIYHLANNETGALEGIYRVSIGGGSATSLVLPTRGKNIIDTFAISPDSSTLVFTFGDRNYHNYLQIHAVPVSGGTIKRLSPPPIESVVCNTHFTISPDSRHVVYVTIKHDQRGKSYNARQIYSVPITGGQSVRLNAPLTSGGIVLHNDTPGLQISPNSSRVVYVASQERAGAFEMYSVPIEGGTPVKVNGTLPSGSTGFGNRFAIAPGKTIFTEGGSRVVYTLIQGQESGKAIYMH